MPTELSQEDVFADDKDPLEAIREIRKAAGDEVSDELEAGISETAPESSEEVQDTASEDAAEMEAFSEDTETDTTKVVEDKNTSENESEKDTLNEDNQEDKTKSTEPKKLSFKAHGKEFEFTQDEVLEKFQTVFGQAMDYTQKMQKIAPYRKMISALEEEGISQDQLNIAIDALKGDKGALQEVMKINKIDPFDLSSDEEKDPYVPKDYGKDPSRLAIDEIIDTISSDKEYKITEDVIDNQWDSASRQVLAKNPGMISGLHADIKSGVYDKVAPIAMKMALYDGNVKSKLDYYLLAGQQLREQETSTKSHQTVETLNKQTQEAEAKFDQASSEAQRKRSASSTGVRSDTKRVIDYLDDDDDKFDAWYKNLQASN